MSWWESFLESTFLVFLKELFSAALKWLINNNERAKKVLSYFLAFVGIVMITVFSGKLIYTPPDDEVDSTGTTIDTGQEESTPYDDYIFSLVHARDEIMCVYGTDSSGVTAYSESLNEEEAYLIKRKEETKDNKERIDICQMLLIKEPNYISLIKELADSYLDYGIDLYDEKSYSSSKENLTKSIECFNRLIEFDNCDIGLSDILYRIGQAYEYMSLLYPEEKSFEKDALQNSIWSVIYYSLAAEKISSSQVYGDYCHLYAGNMLLKTGKKLLVSDKDKRWFTDALNMYTEAVVYTKHTAEYKRCLTELAEVNEIINYNFTIE